MNFNKAFLSLLFFFFLLNNSFVFGMGESQTLVDEVPDLQIGDVGHGVVVTVNRQSVAIQKYDLARQENIIITFNLTESFKIKNVDPLSQLSEGDMVEFSYYFKNDKPYLSRLIVHKQKPLKPVKEFDF